MPSFVLHIVLMYSFPFACSYVRVMYYIFMFLFCFVLFFLSSPPPAVCLLAIRTVRARCWVLLSGLKTFEIIRARYCEKLQAVSSAGLLYIRKDDYSKTLSGDYT